jgi:hypothetical protein
MFHLYPPSKKQIQEVAASIAAASASMNTHEIARALFEGRIGTHHEKFRLGQDTDAVGRHALRERVEHLEGLAAEGRRLQAENERLREALRKIQNHPTDYMIGTDDNMEVLRGIADAALAGEKESKR